MSRSPFFRLSTVLAVIVVAGGPGLASPPANSGVLEVRDVRAVVSSARPAQVTLQVDGVLPDGCTKAGAVSQSRDGRTVVVTIATERHGDICAQVIQNITLSVKLDGTFDDGSYTIRVNAVERNVTVAHTASTPPQTAKASRSAATMVPHFEFDPTWPKQPFPNKWIIGNVIGVAVDPKDHVWILHRPSGLTDGEKGASLNPPTADCCIPAPPVIEFNQAGALVQAWGGPGEGYTWSKPGGEHGLSVDHQGNVWVGNLNDSYVLKFTALGKLLLQVGRIGAGKTSNSDLTALGGATGSVDPATNELFVADGYQHRRVIVFDAESGTYKRHWGAYGKPPDDGIAPKYVPDGPLPPQFETVTCARVSHDGLVYVCDRANHRFQVFKRDGTFVAEKVISPKTIQGTVHDVAFSQDPEQRFLYVPDPRNSKVFILRRSDLEIVGSFGHAGHFAGGLTNGSSVAVDSHGNLYVGEGADGKRVQRFLYKGLRPASVN
jgi:hypothetical protein